MVVKLRPAISYRDPLRARRLFHGPQSSWSSAEDENWTSPNWVTFQILTFTNIFIDMTIAVLSKLKNLARTNLNYTKIWHNIIWYDMIWDMICYNMIWYDKIWCDMMWCDVMWCDVMWCDVMWCDVMWCDVMWCDMIWKQQHSSAVNIHKTE